jgi:hypothetical protein
MKEYLILILSSGAVGSSLPTAVPWLAKRVKRFIQNRHSKQLSIIESSAEIRKAEIVANVELTKIEKESERSESDRCWGLLKEADGRNDTLRQLVGSQQEIIARLQADIFLAGARLQAAIENAESLRKRNHELEPPARSANESCDT